jgi:hypothetical protein
MTVTSDPPPVEDIDAGVIEEARARARHQRRVAGIVSVAAAGFAIIGFALAGGIGGAGPARAPTSHRPPSRTVAASLASCQSGKAALSTSTGSPHAALLSTVGVLRGLPARPPAWVLQRPIVRFNSNLYVDYIRFARAAFGVKYYVFVAGLFSPFVRACQTAVGVHLFAASAMGGVGTGGSATLIEQRGLWVSGSPPGVGVEDNARSDSTLISGIVPDGVATVTFYYPAGKPNGFSHRILPAEKLTMHVVNNVAVGKPMRSSLPPKMVWSAANGETIKTIDPQLR